MSRIKAAQDLSYWLAQAVRHAAMLEGLLLHGNDTHDILIMLANDIGKANHELGNYRDASMKERKQQHGQK